MTKREFMIQYVLSRASAARDLDGDGAARQAASAWLVVSKSSPDPVEQKQKPKLDWRAGLINEVQ